MSTENPQGPIAHELLVLCKPGGNNPNFVYVSILEGSVRVFGKQMLNLFSSDATLSREHFQIEFVNGRVTLTNLSKSNDTFVTLPDSTKHTLRQRTSDSLEIPVKAQIKAGTSTFRLEEMIPCQLSIAPSLVEYQLSTIDERQHEQVLEPSEPVASVEPATQDSAKVAPKQDLPEPIPTRDSTKSSGAATRDGTDSFAVEQLVPNEAPRSLGFGDDDFFTDDDLR